MIKTIVHRSLAALGYELHRSAAITGQTNSTHPRESVEGAIEHIRKTGFMPRTILDVGAAFGSVAAAMSAQYPAARVLLFEPLHEYRPSLDALCKSNPLLTLVPAAVGSKEGEVTFNVHADWVGSSLFNEGEGEAVDGTPRTVKLTTLDKACAEAGTKGPYLIKVDVQGAELEVIKGAATILPETECIVLEVSLFCPFKNGPQFRDVVEFMKERGFVCYDILGALHRPLDGALWQVDLAFVKEDGVFRRSHAYATPEQRQAQFAAAKTLQRQS